MKFPVLLYLNLCLISYGFAQDLPGSINQKLSKLTVEMENEICGLEFVPDGVQDEWGNFIYTSTGIPQKINEPGLNCTGFTKAIADYLFKRIYHTEKALTVKELENRFLDLRIDQQASLYEYERDPFYAQDWIRNCSLAINGTPFVSGSYWDIKDIPGHEFDPKWGFRAEGIEDIASKLSTKYPGSVYFFAISKILNYQLGIRQFAHAGLMVNFTEDGKSITRFFESNVVNSIPRFTFHNEGRYIYLVRVDINNILNQF